MDGDAFRSVPFFRLSHRISGKMTTVATRTTMSYIFQAAPPQVKVHNLPRKAKFFTYGVNDRLTISAWMPDRFDTVNQTMRMTNDRFANEYCEGCERNCSSFLEEYFDEDGDIDHDRLGPHCFVYDEGYHGQHCPEGHVKEDEDVHFDIADMVFEIFLEVRNRDEIFVKRGDTAYLSAGYVSTEDGSTMVFKTQSRSASNVFGSDRYPEAICWGATRRPETLREIVTNYTSTPFNNDLTRIPAFENHCEAIRDYVIGDSYDEAPSREYKFLCNGDGVDALIMLDAEHNIPAFFTMLCAGYKTLPELPHIMLIGASEATLERDGVTYRGYLTIPDAVGKQWFISNDLQLVGQV